MPGITEMATTYNCPNYVGELFAASAEDTPLLSSIGGLTGGESVESTTFGWQVTDLRDAADNRQRVEGADATAFETRTRTNVENVLEIHQEAVSVSYTKMGARRQYGPTGTAVQLGSTTLPADELAEQPPQVELVADELDAGPGGLQQEPVLRRPGDQALERGPGDRLTEITVAHDVVDIGDRGIEEIQQNAFLVPEFRTQQGIPGDQVVVDGAVQQVPLRGRLDDIRLGHAVDPRDVVAQGPGTDSQQISQFTARDDVVELAEQFDEKRLTLGEKNHL